jgi:pectin methylesterase-like acyl-CoA thioesterase
LTVGLGGTYSTIQAAVDAAGNGDTIEIAAGIYREQVTVDGKNITIHGAGSGQTIIEAPDAASLVSNASDSDSGRDETPLGGPSGMLVQDQPRC